MHISALAFTYWMEAAREDLATLPAYRALPTAPCLSAPESWLAPRHAFGSRCAPPTP